jgi:type IV secretion system protein VirD4
MGAFEAQFRFGSALWADEAAMKPLLRGTGPYLGLDPRGRVLRHCSDGPMLMVAGSGAGKGVTGGIMHNACGYTGSMLCVDLKGETAAVSLAAQAAMGKPAFCVNPAGLLGLPNHSTDPLDILKAGAASLVPDAKMIAEMLTPLSGSSSGKYFEEKSRQLIESILIADVEQNGKTGLRNLYRIANAIEGDPDTWIAFGERMLQSGYEHVRRMAAELAFKMRDAPKEASGILGETTKCLSFLDDPAFLAGLDKPDFSLEVLCERAANVYVNVPAEYVGIWSPYLRLLIGVAMLYKQRRPDRPRVYFLIDEAGQLGKADFLMRAMTFGRGGGLLTQAIYQSIGQISEAFGRDGAKTILSSSQVKQFFGVRDLETAEMVSRMLGNQTLEFDAALEQAAAQTRKAHLIRELMAGSDPVQTGLDYAQQTRASTDRKKMARPLMTPDEILRMPEDRQILFVSGINCPPVAAWRKPYFAARDLAGRFSPNPYHPPLDRVRVPTRFGSKWAWVITEPVPDRFRDFPQYEQSGLWSYIEGYRPT